MDEYYDCLISLEITYNWLEYAYGYYTHIYYSIRSTLIIICCEIIVFLDSIDPRMFNNIIYLINLEIIIVCGKKNHKKMDISINIDIYKIISTILAEKTNNMDLTHHIQH